MTSPDGRPRGRGHDGAGDRHHLRRRRPRRAPAGEDARARRGRASRRSATPSTATSPSGGARSRRRGRSSAACATVDDFAALEAADIVIECVLEDLELKASIFQELDQICPPEDILATNTSSLSVTEIAARTAPPDRVIGLHFLQPVPAGARWSRWCAGSARPTRPSGRRMEFVRLLGKTGVEVFEYPGYVTTRVILPFLNEAMHVVMEGVATAEAVDTSMKLGYGLPVGPARPRRPDGPRRGHALDAVPLRGAGRPQVPPLPAAAQDDPGGPPRA